MSWITGKTPLHWAICDECAERFQDTDHERLGKRMDIHEQKCRARTGWRP